MIFDITTCPVFSTRVEIFPLHKHFQTYCRPTFALDLETHDNRLANCFPDIITEFVFSHVIMPHVNIFMTFYDFRF